MATYTTKQGDMWDSIALEQLGNEKYMSALLEANPKYLGTYIFPAGVVLDIPEISEDVPDTLPPWRKN